MSARDKAIERALMDAWCNPHASSMTDGAAFLSALAAAGYAVVPVEPLPELVAAWWRVKNGAEGADTSDYAAYRAMLAAAGETGDEG